MNEETEYVFNDPKRKRPNECDMANPISATGLPKNVQEAGLKTGVTGGVNCTDNDQFLSDWLISVMDRDGKSKAAEVGMIMWSIWKACNLIVWQNTYTHVDEVVRITHITLDQWLVAQSKNFTPSMAAMHSIDGKEQWTIPERDTIKINVDAAIFKNENSFTETNISSEVASLCMSDLSVE
ncbi:hypothetical protein POM88_023900 [Heracleum sosnowskyi]|uniref:Uncharacterized protein n=1 Tax=Heracleum sosnowskyi TaxID=360622 RepID=A0AAD8II52_9APIA|nr:hypothetical protein POM88_023900 [Heracleum sosnowskyi]